MKIIRKDLQEALQIVKPGLSTKEILNQSSSFAFIQGRVITYNDEISISHPVEGIKFEGAIKGEELYGLLSKLTHEDVNLEVTDGELQINSGRVKAGLRLEEEINLPLQEVPDDWVKIKNSSQFQDYVQLAAQTCSNDMSQPKLTCVCIRDGKVIGSDGQRLIQCQLDTDFPVDEFLIPATSALELVKIDPTYIQLEDDWIYFKNDFDTIFSCRRVNDVYMKQESINEVLKIKKKAVIKFPNKILDILFRIAPFSKRDFTMDESVEITIKDNKATLKAETEGTKSWIKEKMTIESEQDLSFRITPSLFIDILGKTKTCHLDKSITKGKFTLKNEWDYIIMFRE